MSRHTTFKIGGPADAFVRPEEPESAVLLLSSAREEGIPLFILGGGANLLVGDRGIRGIVMDCSSLKSIRREGSPEAPLLVACAGLSIDELCLDALASGLGGIEDFFGLPGSVGGAAFMNARCYEVEMSQVLEWVESVDAEGQRRRRELRAQADGSSVPEWSYKRSPYQGGGAAAGELILEAAFRLKSLDDEGAARAAAAMRSRRLDREAKGHYRLPSAGSVFKNDRSLGAPTGKLLDSLGFRGRRIGDAMVSPWHANIFVNAGDAKAADMRALIELAQAEARDRLGAKLESEVILAGEF